MGTVRPPSSVPPPRSRRERDARGGPSAHQRRNIDICSRIPWPVSTDPRRWDSSRSSMLPAPSRSCPARRARSARTKNAERRGNDDRAQGQQLGQIGRGEVIVRRRVEDFQSRFRFMAKQHGNDTRDIVLVQILPLEIRSAAGEDGETSRQGRNETVAAMLEAAERPGDRCTPEHDDVLRFIAGGVQLPKNSFDLLLVDAIKVRVFTKRRGLHEPPHQTVTVAAPTISSCATISCNQASQQPAFVYSSENFSLKSYR